jgi:CRP-like cAMP-binding protein
MGAEKLDEQIGVVYQALQKMPFFAHFPLEFLHELAGACDLVQYEVGQEVLVQGQMNRHLYFLISGRVSVSVDNGVVAELMNIGDVLGEMSVITRQPCTATIVADSEVIVLRLGVELLEQHASAQTDRFKYLLYRVYASILTKKLNETNQKAKHLEALSMGLEKAQRDLQETNASLEKKVAERTRDLQEKSEDLQASYQKLEQQNLEVTASHKKLEELYATKNLTFSKLEDLYTNHLHPLDDKLDQLRPRIDEQSSELFDQVSHQLREAMELLKPITALYSTEKAMQSKKVLLVESNKKQQILAKLALGGTGVDLSIVADAEGIEGAKGPFDVIFFDAASFPEAPKMRERYPGADIVLMTSDSIKEYFSLLQSSPILPNIVSRAESDRAFTIKNIVTTITKLASKDVFGLEKYLSWGADIKSTPVVSSEKRPDYIRAMDEYFETLGIRRTARERAALVTEELLMNAIYDAPVDAEGKSLFNHKNRKEVIYLKPNQQGKLRYATDGMLLAVSVQDPFGSLSGAVLLKYLKSCYGQEAGTLDASKGGAGRGLHQIIENSDLVVFNIDPRKKTEVIALFYLDKTDSQKTSSSFHLFIS